MTTIYTPKTLSYLATPYTKFPGGIWAAYFKAGFIAAKLIRAGLNVYSPIIHCHAIAMLGDIDPLDHSMWMSLDEVMLGAADTLIVGRLESWDQSKGVAMEIEYFEKGGKPIYDLDPESMVMTRRSRPWTKAQETDDHEAATRLRSPS